MFLTGIVRLFLEQVIYQNNDIKRNKKVLKICRRYLNHVQKSVFEGVITEAKLNRLKDEIKTVICKEEDSVAIYEFETLKYSSKEVIGLNELGDNIL